MKSGTWPLAVGRAKRFTVGLRGCGPWLPALVLAAVVFLAPVGASAEGIRLFRIGTGGPAGVYHPIGKLIAQGLTGTGASAVRPCKAGLPGLVGVAQTSGGSVANIRSLATGEIEAGLVQADVAAWAFNGKNVFSGEDDVRNVRAVASLYAEKFQFVVRREAGIRRVPDSRGHRILVDEPGSGTLGVVRIVLDAYGMTETDLQPVYLKPHLIGDKLRTGDFQGFVIMAGVPADVVRRACDFGFSLVSIDADAARRISGRHPYLVPGSVASGVYPGVARTSTVEVYALLLVNAAISEEEVRQITEALWSRRTADLLQNGHPQGRSITLDTALVGLTLPLHPGAARFYRERGMLDTAGKPPA